MHAGSTFISCSFWKLPHSVALGLFFALNLFSRNFFSSGHISLHVVHWGHLPQNPPSSVFLCCLLPVLSAIEGRLSFGLEALDRCGESKQKRPIGISLRDSQRAARSRDQGAQAAPLAFGRCVAVTEPLIHTDLHGFDPSQDTVNCPQERHMFFLSDFMCLTAISCASSSKVPGLNIFG